jgi:hypothetical protein
VLEAERIFYVDAKAETRQIVWFRGQSWEVYHGYFIALAGATWQKEMRQPSC